MKKKDEEGKENREPRFKTEVHHLGTNRYWDGKVGCAVEDRQDVRDLFTPPYLLSSRGSSLASGERVAAKSGGVDKSVNSRAIIFFMIPF